MSLLPIKELFHFEKGSLQSSKCTPGDFDFITAAADWKTHNEYSHECEALIFAAAASGSLGRTHYVNGKFISSDLCFILTPKNPKKYPIDLKFYHLIFQAFKDEIVRNTKSGTSKEAIGLTVFGKYKLPYFDIDKQQEVKEQFVSAQESTLGLDSELTDQLDLVKQLRQAFLREAMQGKLVPQNSSDEPASVLLEKIKAEKERLIKEKKIKKQKPMPPITEDEIPFGIPDNWVWCRLGDIYNSTSGGTPTRSNSEYWNGEINWFKSGELNDSFINTPSEEKITELGLVKSSATLFPIGTILIALYGATAGKLSILGVEGTTNQAVCGFYENLFIHSRFLFYQFLFWREKYVSDSWGQAQPNISQTYLKNSAFCLPPQIEQERIVTKLDKLMAYCDELVASIRESQQQNELLLQQVLREALEPKNVEQV